MQQLGRFTISKQSIEDQPNIVRAVMQGMIVVRAEMLYPGDAIEYVALWDRFEPVEPGKMIPFYDIRVTLPGDGTVSVEAVKLA